MNKSGIIPTVVLGLLAISVLVGGERRAYANLPPVAEAGLSRYAATDPVRLDSSESYDPDNSGPLTYTWTQVSGPPLVISGATTATPTISGFVQTQQIQECQFQLFVKDGQQMSAPDTVKVVIVPSFGPNTLRLENGAFDPSKPTIVFFGGSADGVNGLAGSPWNPGPVWRDRANLIDFPSGYTPDSGYSPAGGAATRTYYKYGDMLIAYLSAVAPDYRQAIQIIGMSSGVDPALDAGIRMNETYRDARYAVNRLTELDGGVRFLEGGTTLSPSEAVSRIVAGTLRRQDVNLAEAWSSFLKGFHRFLASSVEEEQCWIDFCYGTLWSSLFDPPPPSDILWVRTELDHAGVYYWYLNSLTGTDANQFNNGLVAGAYWSVIGLGKNVQLASVPGAYYFRWNGNQQNGAMGFFNESEYPGQLPEPVTLLDLHDPLFPKDDPNGTILTCMESRNAIGYQLLCGSDPYDVARYHLVVDSNSPPAVLVAELPSSDTWWTVKVRDAYGSTIHADSLRVGLPVTVIAYWTLDEVQGNRVADSTARHDGVVHGGALWQPASGKKSGALAFDGVDDYVSTGFVLNPSTGPFSVFAWVKDGARGQVIVGQELGANWLRADETTGALRTDLRQPGSSGRLGKPAGPPLVSMAVITDGKWHRVGFVWDGEQRVLYVDDVEVARDTAADLEPAVGGLRLGADGFLTAGTFWSGLIDDVRVYNRAVEP